MKKKRLMVFALVGLMTFSAVSLNSCIQDPIVEEKRGSITVEKFGEGTISLSADNGVVGTMVSVTIKPSENYYIKSITYNRSDVTILGESYQFEILEGETTLKVIFDKEEITNEGSINLTKTGEGEVTLSSKSGKVGEVIKATVKAGNGYFLKSIKFNNKGIAPKNDGATYDLILVEGVNPLDVVFEKVNEELKEGNIVIEKTGNGVITLSKENGVEGDVIEASIKPDTGYSLKSITFNGQNVELETTSNLYYLTLVEGVNPLVVIFEKSQTPDPEPEPEPPAGEKQSITFKTTKPGIINGDEYTTYDPNDFVFEGVEVSSMSFTKSYLVDVGRGHARLRIGSGKGAGEVVINFASPITLGDFYLVGAGYATASQGTASPKVTISTDNKSDTQTVSSETTSTKFNLAGEVTKTIRLNNDGGNRYFLDGLDLGGAKTEVDLSAKINKLSTTNGSYTISKESGVEGDSVEVITTPNEGYKTNSVIYNGTNLSPTSTDHYTFKMIRGTRDLSVSFLKESTGGGGGGTTPDNELMGNTYIASTEGSYYEGARGLKGIDLKNKLYEITRANHRKISYGGLYDAYETSDVPINPDGTKKNGSIYLTYSGEDITIATMNSNHDTYNREHTWPKSYGFPNDNNNMYSDLHHLRPCYGPINSNRGNKFFADSTTSNTYNPDGVLIDTNSTGFKGDVARMMFYMATRYENSGSDIDLELRNVSGSISSSYYDFSSGASATMGDFESMFRWNAAGLDPVSDFEMNRNNVSHMLQGNRNPFIDHPEFAIMIYDKNYSGPGALND